MGMSQTVWSFYILPCHSLELLLQGYAELMHLGIVLSHQGFAFVLALFRYSGVFKLLL